MGMQSEFQNSIETMRNILIGHQVIVGQKYIETLTMYTGRTSAVSGAIVSRNKELE
jgi:hypothetical protein